MIARWPAHPELRAVLVLEVEAPEGRAHQLLTCWRDAGSSLSPRVAGDLLLLRRRRTHELVTAVVVGETACNSGPGCAARRGDSELDADGA